MPVYMDILNYIFIDGASSTLKIILLGHFVLTALGAIGSFVPSVYFLYNLPPILLIIWKIQDKKYKEPLRLLMAIEICLAIVDVFYIFGQVGGLSRRYDTFVGVLSILTAILQLIGRPFVVLYLLKTNYDTETPSSDIDSDKEEIDEVYVENNPFEPPIKR